MSAPPRLADLESVTRGIVVAALAAERAAQSIAQSSKAGHAATADLSPAGGPPHSTTAANFDAAEAGDPPMGVSPTPSPAIGRATVPPARRRSRAPA